MFIVDKKLERINVKPSDVISLSSSVNRPYVAVEGPAREAEAYSVAYRTKQGIIVALCFYFTVDEERIFLVSDAGPVPEAKVERIRSDARKFLEDMGFFMVEQNIAHLTEQKRTQKFPLLPPFIEDIKKPPVLKKVTEAVVDHTADRKEDTDEDEYEEVVEEVYEEVTEEEGEEPPREENEGNTGDAVLKQNDGDADRKSKKGSESFDLGQEISEIMESFNDLKAPRERVGKNGRQEMATDATPQKGAPEPLPAVYFVEGQLASLAKILILL